MRGLTPENWKRLEALLDQVVDMPVEQRAAWLDEACSGDGELRAQIDELLRQEGSGGSGELIEPVSPLAAGALSFEGRAIPARLGPYELIEQIGRGGMGAVYKARRVDAEYRSTVAIKLVRPGMDSDFVLSRFRRERQTLAKLSHPNIARLLDGGTADPRTGEDTPGAGGVPYIVMEHITGAVISEYCRARRLSVRQRVELFLPICAAVEYAHRNFVIHRDIKPGNILVDETGTPKLLDFGICKLFLADQPEPGATVDMTLTQGMGLMTPDYASPEQVLGEAVSPVSDVYSLGLVLYELLTEQSAHHIEKYTPLGIQEAVCRKEITLPSTAAISPEQSATLRGDLDNILMKALQKEPARRYQSAAEFAADLERYLGDQPVLARPDTTFYRLKKFVRRNRLTVGATAAVLLTALIGGGIAIRQSLLARASDRASRQLAREGLFKVYDDIRELPGTTAARQRIIERIGEYLKSMEANPGNDIEVLHELTDGYRRMAELQGSHLSSSTLGDPRAARESYQRALEYLDKLIALVPGDRQARITRIELLKSIGDIEEILHGPEAALKFHGQAAQAAKEMMNQSPQDKQLAILLATLYLALGDSERYTGELANSEEHTLAALRAYEDLLAGQPEDTDLLDKASSAEAGVGMTQGRLGNLEGALQHYRSSLARRRQLLQLKPLNVNYRRELMIALSHVGDVLGYPFVPNLRRPEQAVEPYEEMLSIARSIHAADPLDARGESDQGVAQYRLASVLPAARAGEKKRLLEASQQFFQAKLEKDPGNNSLTNHLTNAEFLLGEYYRDAGDVATAVRQYRTVVAIADRLARTGRGVIGSLPFTAELRLVALDSEAGRGAEALQALDRLLLSARKESARLANDPHTRDFALEARSSLPRVMAAYSAVHARLGHREDARQWREQALAEWKKFSSLPGFSPDMRRELQALEAARP